MSLKIWQAIASQLPAGSAILDIGAFEGSYCIAARQVNLSTAIFAFEPNPQTAVKLRSACQNMNIAIIEMAVAELKGTRSFILQSAMSKLADSASSSVNNSCQVQATDLDSWLGKNFAAPSLIKIDTEGTEGAILCGASSLLRQHQPIILCEVLTTESGQELMGILPSNYKFFYIDENKGYFQKPQITRNVWRNLNWLFVPEQRCHEIPPSLSVVKHKL